MMAAVAQTPSQTTAPETTSRNLYVTGVDPCVTEPELLQLFLQYGHVEQHKLMVNIKTGQSRGFGFVMFRDVEDAVAALAGLNGFALYGKPLSVKFADDKTRLPGDPTCRLFMRNIPASEHTAVSELCAPYGRVVDVRLYWDERRSVHSDTAASHTVGTVVALVEMESVEAAQAVVHGMNNSLRFVSGDTANNNNSSAGNASRVRPLQVKLISTGTDEEFVNRVGTPFVPGQTVPPRHHSAAALPSSTAAPGKSAMRPPNSKRSPLPPPPHYSASTPDAFAPNPALQQLGHSQHQLPPPPPPHYLVHQHFQHQHFQHQHQHHLPHQHPVATMPFLPYHHHHTATVGSLPVMMPGAPPGFYPYPMPAMIVVPSPSTPPTGTWAPPDTVHTPFAPAATVWPYPVSFTPAPSAAPSAAHIQELSDEE